MNATNFSSRLSSCLSTGLAGALALALACTPTLAPPTATPGLTPESPPESAHEPSPDSTPDEVTDLPAPTLRVASWNLHRFGHGQHDLVAVRDVLDDYDLIAIQEMMSKEAALELVAAMPDYGVLLTDSPRPIEGRYREYYAFVYRLDRLDPVFNSYVPDPEDQFVREPFLGCFALLASTESPAEAAAPELCLMTVHIVFGDRVAQRKLEIEALDDALRWAQSARDPGQANWILLGDYNRVVDDGDADLDPETEWHQLLDRQGLRHTLSLVGPEVPTTLGQRDYANAYDHIFVSDPLRPRIIGGGRRELVAEFCEGDYARCRATVSDHAPVWVELRLDGE